MSIGTSHVFSPLTKDSKAIDGQRLVRLIAKGKQKAPTLQESMCVSIPVLTAEEVVEHIDTLLPHVVSWLQGVQDKIIREYRVESGAHDVHEELFNVAHCVEWLASNDSGSAYTKEYLTEWFMSDYGDVATEWITARFATLGKVGVSEDVVQSKVNVLRDVIAGWSAGGRYKPTMPQLRMMIAFSGDVECDSVMSMIQAKSIARLEELEKEMSEDSLGF